MLSCDDWEWSLDFDSSLYDSSVFSLRAHHIYMLPWSGIPNGPRLHLWRHSKVNQRLFRFTSSFFFWPRMFLSSFLNHCPLSMFYLLCEAPFLNSGWTPTTIRAKSGGQEQGQIWVIKHRLWYRRSKPRRILRVRKSHQDTCQENQTVWENWLPLQFLMVLFSLGS